MQINKLFWLPVILLLAGCDDIFEKDISGGTVSLIAPADSVITRYSAQHFLWERVEGAVVYRFTVVSPSFLAPEVCVLDTLVDTCCFDMVLSPGVYAWRIRAENSAWKTGFAERTLTVAPEQDAGCLFSGRKIFYCRGAWRR